MPQLAHRMLVPSIVAALAAVALVGCAPSSPTPSAEPSASATAVPAEPAAAFTAPTSCTELLGSDLEQQFLADGNVLFSDSNGDGIHPGEPVGQDGGDPFACLYGKDMVDLSTFELSAQAVDNDEHEGVLAVLASRGLTEEEDGEFVIFAQEGTEGGDPAIVHILYPDAWITAYSTFGGATRLAEIRGWAETVATQVHSA